MASYVLAADFGTSSLKLGLFNESCELVRLAPGKYAYDTTSRKPWWVEQDPKDWYQVFKKAVRDTLKKYNLQKDQIECVNIGAHMGLVCIDKNGKTLKPAILFFDQRTTKQCEKIKKMINEDDLTKICGNRVSTVQTATQIMWLKENEPNIYAKTYKFLITPGYISFLLTGEYSYDWTHSSWSLLFDIRKGKWSDRMFETFGISREKFPETILSCKILGNITREAAEDTGLKSGIPVMVGGSDTPLAALAQGLTSKDSAMITAGSVSSIIACTDKPNFSLTLLNRCHAVPNRWLMQGAMNAHSNVFNWLINEFYKAERIDTEHKRQNIYELVDREIKKSKIGSNGILFLPYFAGERCPIWDPYARGVIYGLMFHNRRGDIMRSAYEGMTYAAKHNLETIEKMGISIDELKIVGGGAMSEIWNQIKADVLGKKIIVAKAADASLIGSGKLACYGIGWIKELLKPPDDAYDQIFLPRNRYGKKYSEYFKLYKQLYLNLKKLYKRTYEI